MKLEVLFIPVSDVDRAKLFYEKLGFRLDIDYVANEDFRVIQFTPPSSEASIIFGKGITSAQPGSIDHPVLAVYDIDAARDDLIARGIDVSEVFHYAGGPFNNALENPRVGGRDPQGRSYYSFASFEDPDGNGWLLQNRDAASRSRVELDATTGVGHCNLGRTPPRDGRPPWPLREVRTPPSMVGLVRGLTERGQSGSNPEEVAAAANRYMEEVLHVFLR